MNDEKRIALVVGGSRGIGRATVLRLARSGFDIWLTYRSNHEAAESVKAEIEQLGRQCELFAFDVADFQAVKQALEARCEQDIPYAVIFNAGIVRDNLMIWMNQDEWSEVVDTNLTGFYNITRTVLFSMLSQKRGRIIAISSTSGQVGQAGQVNYSASKAGLIGAVKALAREVGRKGVLVNVVSPGVIKTEMTDNLPADKVLPLIPVNRFGEAEEVAGVIDFLCSDDASYIHGQVIGVNGGLAM